MSRYKAYPEYKDSETEWLGKIPSCWEAKRLGQFFEERREKVSDEDYPALSVTMQGIVPQLETAAKTDAGDNRKLVRKNDFVINSRSDRKGSSGVSSCDGSVSLISIVMTPREIHPPFAHHLLRSYPFQEEFYRYGKGIVADLWSTNSSEMKNILIPDISLSEQEKIAAFLDHETAKIDALIEKQQRLIELLKEKRQAVISHAVTKGLNPNAPMKDSGVEWLGEVPSHWKVASLGYYAQISTGATPDRSNQSYWNGSIPWIKTGEVKYDEIFEAEEYISVEAVAKSSVKLSPPGTVLMAMYGQGVTRGRVAILGVAATYNQACAAINTRSEIWNRYLIRFFMASYHAITDDGNETSQMNLNADIVGKFKISIPPLNEQHQIVDYITPKIEKFDLMIDQAETAISLMLERRTALISAAVTGKIDVRDWQPTAVQDEAGIECCANLS